MSEPREATPSFGDLELRIFRGYSDGYAVELCAADRVLESNRPPLPSELDANPDDPRRYGTALFTWLFDRPLEQMLRSFAWTIESSRSAELRGVRLRICLDPEAPELAALRWETLHDPKRDEPLFVSMLLSRYLRTPNARAWSTFESVIRVLVLAADPDALASAGLGEAGPALLRDLESIARSPGQPIEARLIQGRRAPTLLRGEIDEGCQIVHVMTPGVSVGEDAPVSFAPAESASLETLSALTDVLVRGAPRPPYLVFLTVAPPAGGQHWAEGMRLAPMLIEAGAYAVVAIQGEMTSENLQRFTHRFYGILLRTGLVDLAVAEARAEIYFADADHANMDWTRPVLYMRTPDGRLFDPRDAGAH